MSSQWEYILYFVHGVLLGIFMTISIVLISSKWVVVNDKQGTYYIEYKSNVYTLHPARLVIEEIRSN